MTKREPETFSVRNDLCPRCGTRLEAATVVEGKSAPGPEDISMCAQCGSILQFDANLFLREMKEEQIAALPREARAMINKLRFVFQLGRVLRPGMWRGGPDLPKVKA